MAETGSGTTGALPPEVQEKLDKLAKLEKDNAALGYQLRAWQKLGKEGGDVIRYDANGIPLGFNTEDDGNAPAPVAAGNHPLAGVVDNPQAADAYFQQLYQAQLNKAGYVTQQQAQQMALQAAQLATGNAMVWRMFDRLTSQKDYQDLANPASPLYQRTAKVLADRRLAQPLTVDPMTGQPFAGPVPLDQWQYRDLESLRLGADLAQMELSKEAAAKTASETAAKAAQEAGGLAAGASAGAGTAGAGASGKPDFGSMKTPEEIVTALDGALAASEGAQPR